MITDPSWFYSSLAQTSAAIVGLMGAILIARIMDHLLQIRASHKELLNEIKIVGSGIEDFIKELLGLRIFFTDEIQKDREAMQGHRQRFVTAWKDFGSESSGGSVSVDPTFDITNMQQLLTAVDTLIPVFTSLGGKIIEKDLSSYANNIRQAIVSDSVTERGREISANHATRLEHLIESIESFRLNLIPTSLVAIVIVLFVLSVFGILWPLSVLPGLAGSSSKYWMLGGFAVGLLGFFAYLSYVFRELWKYGNLTW